MVFLSSTFPDCSWVSVQVHFLFLLSEEAINDQQLAGMEARAALNAKPQSSHRGVEQMNERKNQ